MSTSQPHSIADTHRFNLLSSDPEMVAIRTLLQLLVASVDEPKKTAVRQTVQQLFTAETLSSFVPLQFGEDVSMERYLDTIHQFFEHVLSEKGRQVF